MTACNYVVFQGTGWASANDETEMNWCKPSTACLKYFFLGGGAGEYILSGMHTLFPLSWCLSNTAWRKNCK